MAKVTFEFDSVEEASEIKDTINASIYKVIIWDILQWIRGEIKYRSDSASEDRIKALEDVRQEINGMLDNYKVSVDD